jgi:peptide/nickel transport system substrate-binding protein
MRAPRLAAFLGVAALLATSCAAPSNPELPGAPGNGGASSAPPKTLNLAVDVSAEPSTGMILIGRGGAVGGENHWLFHSGLTVYDQNGNLTPRLAERVPTLENGDWKASPDGTMEVTWRLRQDARWHDGTPLTAEDFVFGNTVRTNRDLGITDGPSPALIAGTAAPDPHTFVVSWKQPYVMANASGVSDLPALPRHLMESLYQQGDKQVFLASPLWTTGFVGLGPYRIADWQLGSQLEAAAFDQYLLGRPKIDRVIIHYFGDPNAAIAALLAGTVDMTPVGSSYGPNFLVDVRNVWGPSDGGTTLPVPRGVRNLRLQYRDPTAPWARDVNIRRALTHLTNRQELVDTVEFGLSAPVDTFLNTESPLFAQLQQAGLARYPFDPTRAAQLLADAGWSKGADGVFQRNGQPFTFQMAAPVLGNYPQIATAVAGQWAQNGIATTLNPIPSSAANRDEQQANYGGALVWPGVFGEPEMLVYTTGQISTAETRWKGSNFGGYSNPELDDLDARFQQTLDPTQGNAILVTMLKLVADQAVAIPMYYLVAAVMFRKGVTGPGTVAPNQLASSWNAHTWDVN